MISGPFGFFTIAKTVLDDVATAIAGTTEGAPDRVCVVPGAIAWDECECGLLAVNITRHAFTDNFPSDRSSTAQTACQAAFIMADLNIGIARCVPGPLEGELAPECEKLEASAKTTEEDAFTVLKHTTKTLCELKENDDIVDFLVREQQTIGPAGWCVGSTLSFTVALDRS